MNKLISLISSKSKHGNYQMLPPLLLNKLPELKQYSHTRRLDDKRYEWIVNSIDLRKKSIIDIGANVGYFSIRFASEKKSKVLMFEPQSDHSEAIKNIIDFLKIPDITIVNRGVSLDDIKKLEESDFILLFNVLQHAGEDYDQEYVKNISDWENYAIRYLKALKQKSKYLIFQTGYTWLGHKDKLCENNEIMKYSLHLLREAGWQVEKCGIIKSLLIPKYVTVDYKSYFAYLPLFSLKNRIIAKVQNKLKLSRFSYRFAQRPIFICKNSDGK